MQYECPNKIKLFKNWVCKNNVNLPCCFLAEKAILKFCRWDFNINPPSDLIDTIYNNLTLKFKNNVKSLQIINKYKDISITLLEYAICEFNIYSQYNQIIIAFSSCYITINKIKEEEENDKEENLEIQNYLKDILDEIIKNINIDKNLIISCSSSILLFLEKDSEDNEENESFKEKENNLDINYQLEMSRSDSNVSNLSFIDTINNYNDDKTLVDLISEQSINDHDTKNNTVKYNFEKMSPIIKREIIAINEEIKDNFDFFDCEKVNKILFTEKCNKNHKNHKNLKFLNNKRDEDIFDDIN